MKLDLNDTRTRVVGSIAGVAAIGAGVVASRYAVRKWRTLAEEAAYGALPARRTLTVTSVDGVELHVEEAGAADAPLTVVFAHSYMLESAEWHFQRMSLDSRARLVFYDQRCHGRSATCEPDALSVHLLGEDLKAVLDAVAPAGPVVLVGHSMGGIAVLALADAYPEIFGERVVGVALISTSTGQLDTLTLGLPRIVAHPIRAALPPLTKRWPTLVEAARRSGVEMRYLLTHVYSFGTRVDPGLVAFMDRMLSDMRLDLTTSFWPMFFEHDKADALPVLGRVPVVVVTGERDRIIPPAHSQAVAAVVPTARLVVVPRAGHMVNLERPVPVDNALHDLLDRVEAARQFAATTETPDR